VELEMFQLMVLAFHVEIKTAKDAQLQILMNVENVHQIFS
jgi:hypothetical protein